MAIVERKRKGENKKYGAQSAAATNKKTNGPV
jgi:hypothetical protein